MRVNGGEKREVFAPCKINIGLGIGERDEETHLHPINSIMVPVGIYDRLVFDVIDEGVEIVSNDDIPLDEGNICWRAYDRFADEFETGGVRIEIEKEIPVGAGLGGGSSDGAETIRFLAQHSDDELGVDDMLRISEDVGYDVPFFILGCPAFATGYGEVLTRIEVDMEFWVVVAWTERGVNTPDAYRDFDAWLEEGGEAKKNDWEEIFDLLFNGKLVKLRGRVWNDFENIVFQKRGDIQEIKDYFYAWGVEYASLSGSGCSVYGLTHSKKRALEVRENFRREGVRAEIGKPVMRDYPVRNIRRKT